MRYDAEHKERTRQRVLEEASESLRAEGPDRIGVAGIMSKAGLTVGGFYAHFKSKEELIVHAVARSFEDAYALLERTSDPDPRVALARYLDVYLSEQHRDQPQSGCPLAALSGDLRRLSAEAREQYAAGLSRLTDAFESLLAKIGVDEPRREASALLAQIVGAVAIARVVTDRVASKELLRSNAATINARYSLPSIAA